MAMVGMYPRVEDAKMIMQMIVDTGGESERLFLVDAIGDILRQLPVTTIFKGNLVELEHRKEGE